jgi:hypothetical protein
MFSKTYIIKTPRFWLPTYYVWWTCFATGRLFLSPICSFIRVRLQTSYRRFSRKKEKKLSRSFNVMFHFSDDVFFLNTFCEFVIRIYSIGFEKKDTTDPTRSASYLELHLEIHNEGRLRTKLHDKRDDFNFSKIRRGPSKDKVFNLRCSFVFIKHIWLIVGL